MNKPPRQPKRDSESTNSIARAIIEADRKKQDLKTAKLRELRLAKEAAEPEPAAKSKKAAAKPKKAKR